MPCGPKWHPAIAALGGTLALVSCAVAPPSGPSAVAVPPQGKNLATFQQEDAECRTYAGGAIGGGAAAASDQNLQTRYDIAYIQCMYSHGNSMLRGQNFGARYPVYAGVYPFPGWGPGFYPWYGGLFGSGIVVFGGRGHHHHHFHHSFPGAFHGGSFAAGGMLTGRR